MLEIPAFFLNKCRWYRYIVMNCPKKSADCVRLIEIKTDYAIVNKKSDILTQKPEQAAAPKKQLQNGGEVKSITTQQQVRQKEETCIRETNVY